MKDQDLKNCQKIVNCATIKETEKLKETMVGVQVDLAGGHQYPPGSILDVGEEERRQGCELGWMLLTLLMKIA